MDGVFGLLTNVVWTSAGPCAVEGFELTRARLQRGGRHVTVHGIDKFPRMVDYVVPTGVRIADADRVRLGAHLASGTTVMHEGFVNFNAGTLGASMVEGRISAGVVVGDGSDIGGGASIMGTLSGGGKEVISIGERCLLGANAGIGISLGDDCVVEAGCYVTAGTKVTLPGDGRQGRQGARAVRRQQRALPSQLGQRRHRGRAAEARGHRPQQRAPRQRLPRWPGRDAARQGRRRCLVVVLVFVGVGFLVDREGVTPFFDSHGCTAEVDGLVVDLTLEQAENAALITAIALQRGLPARAASIALATAYQESEILNIEHGDRDSVGLFQQRPSQGWGTVEQILDPVYSTNAFYDGLVEVEGYEGMEITAAAQAVQRSAYPDAYADHEADGRALASALTGNHEAAFWCDTPGDSDEASDRLDGAGLVRRAAAVREELSGSSVHSPSVASSPAASPPATWTGRRTTRAARSTSSSGRSARPTRSGAGRWPTTSSRRRTGCRSTPSSSTTASGGPARAAATAGPTTTSRPPPAATGPSSSTATTSTSTSPTDGSPRRSRFAPSSGVPDLSSPYPVHRRRHTRDISWAASRRRSTRSVRH